MTENAVTESAENTGTAINDSENMEKGISEEEFDQEVLKWARALRRATLIIEMGKAIDELDDQWLNRIENTDDAIETIKFYFEKRKALAEEFITLTAPKSEGAAPSEASPHPQ